VLCDDDGVPYRLVRLRDDGAGLHGELLLPGRGWVEDARAFDVMRNGQDYDLVDEVEAAAIVAKLDPRS
jgi:hypothetical protein